ncbi:MAG: MarR family transcriptional regulator [bacterium]|nr:MarR family transcriptional regulator [bacterium]
MTENILSSLPREQIEDILFKALRSVYRFERLEVEEFDLSYPQIYLLKYLKRNPGVRISEIAEEMKMKIFGATRLVDQLEEKEFLKRKRDSNDKRNIFVFISTKGKRMLQKIEDHSFSTIMTNLETFDEEDLLALVKLTTNLDKILGV